MSDIEANDIEVNKGLCGRAVFLGLPGGTQVASPLLDDDECEALARKLCPGVFEECDELQARVDELEERTDEPESSAAE